MLSLVLAFLAAPFMFKPEASPKKGGAVKPNPETLDGFISWLEKKPKSGTYVYWNTRECLFSQYGKEMGWGGKSEILPGPYMAAIMKLNGGPDFLEPFGNVACMPPYTFGGALKRAKKYREQYGQSPNRGGGAMIAFGIGRVVGATAYTIPVPLTLTTVSASFTVGVA